MRVESTSGKHAERRTDQRAPRWAINATNSRPALVAITRRTGIVRGALVLIIVTVLLWLLMMAIFELELV